jgi:hypothetical protein
MSMIYGGWIDVQPLINGRLLVWYFEGDEIKAIVI